MSEIREKIYFVKQQIKAIGEYLHYYKFNERRLEAISHRTTKEFFLKPFTMPEKNFIIGQQFITLLHIYYNQLRETNRPHLGTIEADDTFIKAAKFHYDYLLAEIEKEYQQELVNV